MIMHSNINPMSLLDLNRGIQIQSREDSHIKIPHQGLMIYNTHNEEVDPHSLQLI